MSVETDASVWMPLGEAAEHLGLSKHQLRRRIRAGQIASRQVHSQHGPAYEVRVDGDATVASAVRQPDDRNGNATVRVTPPLTELVNLLRETQRANVELAGMVGSLQQRLAYAEDRIRMLEAPKAEAMSTESPLTGAPANDTGETTQMSSESRNGRPWWRFWSERAHPTQA